MGKIKIHATYISDHDERISYETMSFSDLPLDTTPSDVISTMERTINVCCTTFTNNVHKAVEERNNGRV